MKPSRKSPGEKKPKLLSNDFVDIEEYNSDEDLEPIADLLVPLDDHAHPVSSLSPTNDESYDISLYFFYYFISLYYLGRKESQKESG